MNASPIHKREEEQTTVAPRPPLLRVDWMLLLATLGLIVCSLITIGDATRDDVPGSPHYYLDRQLLFAGIWLILMFGISRIDYSRLRERPRAGRGGRSIWPSSTSSRPSWASCCWCWRCRPSWSTACAGCEIATPRRG